MNFKRGPFLSIQTKGSKVLFALLLSFFVSSCANLSQLEKDSFTEISLLEKQFKNNTDNALYHIKLGAEYEKIGKAQSSNYYYKNAIAEYKEALTLESNNNSLKLSLYQLLYQGVVEWFAEFDELEALYNSIDFNLRKNFNPPHFALFQRESASASYSAETEKKLEDILFKAVLESPHNPAVNYFLSNFLIAQKQYIFGIEVLKRAVISQPENQFLNMQLGIAYEAYANKDYCPFEHQKELNKSLNLLQAAAREIPNNPYLNATLATLYERLNVSILMVDTAKKLVASDPSPESKLTLAEALSNAGQLGKAELIYKELIDQGVTYTYLSQAMINAENGNWARSYESTKKYIALNQRLPIYPALLHLALEEILQLTPTPLSKMSRYLNIANLGSWQHTLLDYWYDRRSEKQVVELATNICKETEANFLIGLKKLKAKDTESAKTHFEEIISSKTYSFVEYRVASHLIKLINN